jgi:drug/metabolite transporter (DMT)-like permease
MQPLSGGFPGMQSRFQAWPGRAGLLRVWVGGRALPPQAEPSPACRDNQRMPPITSTALPGTLPRLSPKVVGRLAALVTVIIWTAFIVVARASADPSRAPTLTPFDIVFARLLGAGMVMLPLGWWLTQTQRVVQREAGQLHSAGSLWGFSPLPLRITLLTGLFGGILYGLFAYSGFVFAPAAHASVLLPGSLPLWTTLLAVYVLGERISGSRVIGLLCIVAGDLLVGGASLLHAFDGSGVWRGDVLFMLGAFTWSCYSVLVRKHSLPAVHATTAITVFAFFAYVPVYAALVWSGAVAGHVFTAPFHDVLLQMLMQGVLSVVVSGISFNMMIRTFGPVRSTMLTAVVPGLSALSAALLLGEPLPWNVLCGLALVTLGIVFGVRQAGAKKP